MLLIKKLKIAYNTLDYEISIVAIFVINIAIPA